jgi:iron complex transport system substrate-binding protein
LALGLKPYAMTSYLGETNSEWLPGTPLKGIKDLGEQANLEAVLEASPDLILAWETQDKIYDSLSKVAPTLLVGESPDWRADFQVYGQLFGKSKEVDQWLKQYDEKAKAAKQKIMTKVGPGKTAVFFRILEKEYRVYAADQKLGGILNKDLGFVVPEKIKPIKRRETISMEALPQFDADYYFVQVGGPVKGGDKAAEKRFAELEQSSIWKSLTAVKNNHVIQVPYWMDLDLPNVNEKSIQLITDKLLNMK